MDEFDQALAGLGNRMFDAKIANLTSAIQRARGGGKSGAAQPTEPMAGFDADLTPGAADRGRAVAQGLYDFGGGAQNGNDTGLTGKLLEPIFPGDGRRAAQSMPNALANTAHAVSPAGIVNMFKGAGEAVNRLTTPRNDVAGYYEQGDAYSPYTIQDKARDAFGAVSVLPMIAAPFSMVGNETRGAVGSAGGWLNWMKSGTKPEEASYSSPERSFRAYHGSRQNMIGDKLMASEDGAMGPGIYIATDFTSPDGRKSQGAASASSYARSGKGSSGDYTDGRIYPLDVTAKMATRDQYLGLVEKIEAAGTAYGKDAEVLAAKKLKDQGYDGAHRGGQAIVWNSGTIKSATSGETLFANPGDTRTAALGATLEGATQRGNALAKASDVDPLGYYSQLDRVLGSLNPKDSVTLDTLAKRGVKAAELEARGLLPDLKSGAVRVSDLQAKAGERLALNEKTYGKTTLQQSEASMRLIADEIKKFGVDDLTAQRTAERLSDPHMVEPELAGVHDSIYNLLSPEVRSLVDRARNDVTDTTYKQNSLDPSNPTYRETVLHLPDSNNAFESGHFPEPNIVGHMMTSLNEVPGGGRAFTLDQIQSDWGQKLRDGGVRDEAKIAGLTQQLDAVRSKLIEKAEKSWTLSKEQKSDARGERGENWQFYALKKSDPVLYKEFSRLHVERSLAEQNTAPGHPLVNTTDQWTNTTLRRAIQQAVDANADHIAVPNGKTVLGYNPGKEHGMQEFYDKIVPKNLQNILQKLDPATQRQVIDQLVTPSGPKGEGFTVFPLSPTAKANARKGMPLFANNGDPMLMNALAMSTQPDASPPNALARRP